ncbi:MAG: hypothetical protein P1V81_15995 [Planctomycetota bacterium]|nr:hypothetical protein [Planctomycetota bacterium]
MDDLGVIGLSWRQGGPDALARFTLDREVEAERLAALKVAMGVDELVYLATCNRVELYFRVQDPSAMGPLRGLAFEALCGQAPEPGEAERNLRAWAGEGAAEHLFLVAAGLDSAEVGETEINGQLRRALDLALEVDLVPNHGGRLEDLIEEALKLARRIRREAHLDEGHTSLAEIALDRVRERLARAAGPADLTRAAAPVLLVGVSPMNERCALSLRGEGAALVIANRTRANAEAFAVGAERCLSLDELDATPPAVEVIVTATASPEAVLGAELLSRLADLAPSGEPPLVIDFAVPPDVDPAVARSLGIERIGMDEIIAAAEATRERRLQEAAAAREEIDAALDRLRARLGDEHVAPFVSALQRRYRKVARQGAERLLDTQLSGLAEPERAAVIHFAEKLAGRFAHLPSTGLRGVSRVAGPAAVDAFLARADKEMAQEFALAARERKARQGGNGQAPDSTPHAPGSAQSGEPPAPQP